MTTITYRDSAATSPTALQLAEQMALQQVLAPPPVDQCGGVDEKGEGSDE